MTKLELRALVPFGEDAMFKSQRKQGLWRVSYHGMCPVDWARRI